MKKQFLVNVAEVIKRSGHAVIVVGANHERAIPGYSYTVGLSRIGLPELLILALPSESAHGILNDAAKRHCDKAITAGEQVEKIANFPLRAREVPAELASQIARVATELLDTPISVLQLVWPDERGRFPGEPGMNPDHEAAQVVELLVNPTQH